MTLKSILEASLKRQVNILKMNDAGRTELKALIDNDDLKSDEFDKAFMELCQGLEKNGNYTRDDTDSFVEAGSIDEIVAIVKKGKLGLPSIRVGDLVAVGGVKFVKLDTGKIVDLHHKK